MRKKNVGELFVLLILLALVSAILFVLVRFWGECQADTAYTRERVSWPTTTVEATLVDVELRTRRIDRPPDVVGHYTYSFGGAEHTAEVYENVTGYREEREKAANELEEAGKVVDLEVQYDPDDPSVVSDEIVTFVTSCRWWVGGFLIFFSLMMLLILRGLFRLLAR